MPQSIFAPLLTKGIDRHGGMEYERIPKIWPDLVHVISTKSRHHFVQNWIPLTMPSERTPGGPFEEDAVRPDFDRMFTIVDYGKVIPVAAEDVDDDQYGMLVRWASSTGGQLALAYSTLEEWQVANMYAITFVSTTSPAPNSADGDPYYSTSHPISASQTGTTVSNKASSATQLSMAGLQGARANLQQQFMANNETFIHQSIDWLMVNPNFEEIALQLRRATYTNADLQPNTLQNSFKVISNPYFRLNMTGSASDAYDGWVCGTSGHQVYFVDRQGVKHYDQFDGDVNSHKYFSTRRFTMGPTDWRGGFTGWA